MKKRDPEFEIVFVNALNGIDPDSLTEEEIKQHEAWVEKNWDDLNSQEEE